ncbi:hypothetical protein HDU77_003157 [Chytriomyces hyalinus]|nr:hypothetical protein HDU77_003157 [Chytriomyces hyalinus]
MTPPRHEAAAQGLWPPQTQALSQAQPHAAFQTPSMQPLTPQQEQHVAVQEKKTDFEAVSESVRSASRSRRSVSSTAQQQPMRRLSVVPSLTLESPKNSALPLGFGTERLAVDPFRPTQNPAADPIPHPDTLKFEDAQRTFMSNLYLADDPDMALLPFWRCISSKTSDITLQHLINTPLLKTGETPLHMAAKWGKPLTMLALLKNGAAPRLRTGYTCSRFPCYGSSEYRGRDHRSDSIEDHLPATSTGRPQRKRRAATKPEYSPADDAYTVQDATQITQCPGCLRILAHQSNQFLIERPQTALQIMFTNPAATLEWIEISPPSLLSTLFRQFSASISDRDSNGSTLLHNAMATNNPELLNTLISVLDTPVLTKMSQSGDISANTPFHVAALLANPRLLPKSLLTQLQQSPSLSFFQTHTNISGSTPVDICIEKARKTIVALGLHENEIFSILASMESIPSGNAVLQKQLTNLLLNSKREAASIEGGKRAAKNTQQFLVRRLCLLAAASTAEEGDDSDVVDDWGSGEVTFKTLIGCRAVVTVFLGSEERVKEFFDAAIQMQYM